MPRLRTYRLFISHAWTYGDYYDRLIALLDAAPRFDWANYSVPEDDPLHRQSDARLRAALARQVRLTNVVLVISGVYASHSDWMEEELIISDGFRKPIIGLVPRGNQRASTLVQHYAVEMVKWSTSSIVDAIRRHAI
jgi:hypothetical protein